MSQSGLKSITRNWDDNSSQDTPIEWSSTPPSKPLDPVQQRLLNIKNALAGKQSSSENPINAFKKRPSEGAEADNGAPQAKKSRQLPNSWGNENTPLSSSSTSKNGHAAPGSRSVAKVFLSSEQSQILKLVEDGQSIFYTGSAGTGKSVLLREIIRTLKKKHIKSSDAVAVTASTGIAACNIGGVTIHSFAGIGLGIESADVLADRIKKNKKSLLRWTRTKVLIIDEVSMVDGELFDKLAEIGSIVRKRPNVPFGGIQLIVTGDFFQLPPVTKSGNVKFAFEATWWKKTIKKTFNLTKVFRQTDQEFVDMLNEMRFGRLSQESIQKFKSLSRQIKYSDGLGPTELFPRREDVDRANATRLTGLCTDSYTYNARDVSHITEGYAASVDSAQAQKIFSNFMAPSKIVLRVGAQVMYIKNTDEMLVNGSMGRVIDFQPITEEPTGPGDKKDTQKTPAPTTTANKYPVVEFPLLNGGSRIAQVVPEQFKVEANGQLQYSRTQLPIILAWAMSIHKSQGQTLDRVKVDLGKVFEKGQAYVALSRATSLAGLQVLNFDANKVQAHPKVATWSKTLETISDN